MHKIPQRHLPLKLRWRNLLPESSGDGVNVGEGKARERQTAPLFPGDPSGFTNTALINLRAAPNNTRAIQNAIVEGIRIAGAAFIELCGPMGSPLTVKARGAIPPALSAHILNSAAAPGTGTILDAVIGRIRVAVPALINERAAMGSAGAIGTGRVVAFANTALVFYGRPPPHSGAVQSAIVGRVGVTGAALVD